MIQITEIQCPCWTDWLIINLRSILFAGRLPRKEATKNRPDFDFDLVLRP
jgi:hypothetical protein